MKACDLHTHSVFSDGTETPCKIIDGAVGLGLCAVALCDHNTVEGIPDLFAAAEGKPIEAIAGAEFSVDYDGNELHLLGLYIPKRRFSEITEMMRAVDLRKEKSNLDLIESLGRVGIRIDYAKIKAKTPSGRVNRAHIARELTALGYTKSVSEAFDTLLSPAAGHYVKPKWLGIWEMLDYLHGAGAVSVLAHPFLSLQADGLAELLPRAGRAGLVGMECYYSAYDAKTTETALDMARTFGLLPSGGSDYHGATRPDVRLGVGRGNLKIPYAWAEALKRGVVESR